MADNPLVSNSYLSTNPDIRPRGIEKTNGGANCLTQVMALDIGGSGAESLVTAANPLPVTGSFSTSTASTLSDDSQDVTTAGTRVQLTAATSKKIIITAKVTNTGTIWVGGSTVAAGRGIPLVALQNVTLELSDVSAVYIDATVNGEGVTYAYTN